MSSKTGTEDEKPVGDLRASDEGRVHEFAQQQHVETFKKLAEAERTIVRQRAELDEWERLHPVPSEMHRDAFAREMVEIYAPGLFAELDSAKAMALLARAALRIELGEIDALVPKGCMHRLIGVAQQNGAHVSVSFRNLPPLEADL